MQVTINTDAAVEGREAFVEHSTAAVTAALARFAGEISRVEVQLGDVNGSIRTRASEGNPCSRTEGDVWLGGFQDGQHGHASTEEAQPAMVGGKVLVVSGSGAEEVAQFVVTSAEPGG